MLIEEAQWFARQIQMLDGRSIFPMLNVGSSTEKFRTVDQHFIDECIFKPARDRNYAVTHMDIESGQGVDIVGDLCNPALFDELSTRGFNSIFCSNILEHVVDRQQICQTLQSILPFGGYIFVSCPYRYPFHPDPIDTMFRPDIDELYRLFPETSIIEGEIIRGKTLLGYHSHDPAIIFKTVLRIFTPFYKPWNWLKVLGHSPWLFRHCYQTCLVLRKCRERSFSKNAPGQAT